LRNVVDQAQYDRHRIVDIGEVAAHLAVVKELDRYTLEDGPGEQEISHVWPAPWPVDREKPQAGHRKAIDVAVRIRHQLVGSLGRGIEADRMFGAVDHRKRN